jgi:DNA-binding NtrC family response regulator
MERIRRLVDLVAEGTLPVLLLGETGVGKEAMAELIHARSPRANGPLVRVNCAALPESLLESELFGHERGAFSGAVQAKPGLLETAHQGTLFLDEVAEMPLPTQAKMLRVFEAREVTRLGAVRPRAIDVRFVAATNRDLPDLVESSAFRRDMYHRLCGMTLAIPPLRERIDEISQLAHHFVARACEQLGRPPTSIEPAAIAWLERQPWPGNVRELRNVAERAVMLARGAPIGIEHLQDPLKPYVAPASPDDARSLGGSSSDLRTELDAIERARIEEALVRVGGNQTKAAQLLGISRRTLIGRLNAYDLPRPRRAPKERS